MNELILKRLAEQATTKESYYSAGCNGHPEYRYDFDKEKFAELIVKECMEVAASQRNPANLNYKPSERFVEDLRQHFGVEE